MRVHDIALLTDLSRQDPNNPREEQIYDGTSDGAYDSLGKFEIDDEFSDAKTSVDSYWTSPWPTLHIVVNWAFVSLVFLAIHYTIDILMNRQVQSGYIEAYTPILESNGYIGEAAENKLECAAYKALAVETERANPWSRVDEGLIAIGTLLFAITITAGHPALYVAFALAYGYLVMTVINAINHERMLVAEGSKDNVDAGLDIVYKGLLVLAEGIGYLAQGLNDFMSAEDAAADAIMSEIAGYKIVPWGRAHSYSLISMIAGIAIIALAVGMFVVGALIGFGVL
ncbi:MAG: hypothetical protein EAX95_10085 [Candidatus Thorarchaeota archaeon]|nr:hypothetical protein [Candidatus Thorarchaeota archaeon]